MLLFKIPLIQLPWLEERLLGLQNKLMLHSHSDASVAKSSQETSEEQKSSY